MYYYGARYYDRAGQRFISVDPLASKYPGWSPYVYTLGNPVKYVDPDGAQPQSLLTPYSRRWWERAFGLPRNPLIPEQRQQIASGIHRYWSAPAADASATYSAMGTGAYFAGNLPVAGFCYFGSAIGGAFSLLGMWTEAIITDDPAARSAATWETVMTVVQDGVTYALKAGPAGEVAWFIVDFTGRIIRALTNSEVTSLGLDDTTGRDDGTSRRQDSDEGSNNEGENRSTNQHDYWFRKYDVENANP